MADRYKILSLETVTAAAGKAETPTGVLYTVPLAAAKTVASDAVEVAPLAVSIQVQTLVTSIIVCNISTGLSSAAAVFGIKLEKNYDDDAAVKRPTNPGTYDLTAMLFKKQVVADDNTVVLSLGLTLSAGDRILGGCTDADCDFTVMGIEITSGRGPDA